MNTVKEHVYTVSVNLTIAVPPVKSSADTAARIADAVNEILRHQQRCFTPTSNILDYEIDKIDNLGFALFADGCEESDLFATPDIEQ